MTDAPASAALSWGAATHTGRVRTENEDAFVAERWCSASPTAWAATRPARWPAPSPPARCAIASATAPRRSTWRSPRWSRPTRPSSRARTATPQQRGMGTTLTAMVVLPDSTTAAPPRAGQRRRQPHLRVARRANCAESRSTTATCRSSCPPGTSPSTRLAATRAATSSPVRWASNPRCGWTRGCCRSCRRPLRAVQRRPRRRGRRPGHHRHPAGQRQPRRRCRCAGGRRQRQRRARQRHRGRGRRTGRRPSAGRCCRPRRGPGMG
jgi:hypothetical protein